MWNQAANVKPSEKNQRERREGGRKRETERKRNWWNAKPTRRRLFCNSLHFTRGWHSNHLTMLLCWQRVRGMCVWESVREREGGRGGGRERERERERKREREREICFALVCKQHRREYSVGHKALFEFTLLADFRARIDDRLAICISAEYQFLRIDAFVANQRTRN